jgi:hypothetical protein
MHAFIHHSALLLCHLISTISALPNDFGGNTILILSGPEIDPSPKYFNARQGKLFSDAGITLIYLYCQ